MLFSRHYAIVLEVDDALEMAEQTELLVAGCRPFRPIAWATPAVPIPGP